MTRRIDITPSWSGLLPVMRLVIEAGETVAAKEAMWAELARMALAADKWNTHTREGGK